MPESPSPEPEAPELPGAEPDLSFEQAFERLEGLVREMESDEMPLSSLIEGYERGIQLHALCQKRLEEAQGRIEMIRQRADGEIAVEPFDEDAAASVAATESAAEESPADDGAAASPSPPSLKDDAELF